MAVSVAGRSGVSWVRCGGEAGMGELREWGAQLRECRVSPGAGFACYFE